MLDCSILVWLTVSIKCSEEFPSMLWQHWLDNRKGIHPAIILSHLFPKVYFLNRCRKRANGATGQSRFTWKMHVKRASVVVTNGGWSFMSGNIRKRHGRLQLPAYFVSVDICSSLFTTILAGWQDRDRKVVAKNVFIYLKSTWQRARNANYMPHSISLIIKFCF